MVIKGHIVGREIVVEGGEEYCLISPEATIERCTVRMRVSAKQVGVHGRFLETAIMAEKQLVGLSWTDATLMGCRFVGTFRENEFGNLAPPAGGPSRDCDFTKAVLHDCQFFGEATRTNRFPPWPHVVVLEPHANRLAMKDAARNEKLTVFVDAIEYLDSRLSGLVVNCNSAAPRLGVGVQELSDFLLQFEFVESEAR